VELDLLIPGLPAKADHFLFGISSLVLLRDAKRTMLFDCGPFRVRRRLLAELKKRELQPQEVRTVFVSHLHWDHVENIDLFRHAEILIPRREWEYAHEIRPEDWGTPPYVLEMLQGLRVTLLEDREQELYPGVHTLLLPGHSVGLQGLVVSTEDGPRCVLASDAVWSARDVASGHPDVAFFDPEEGLRSLRRALAAGDVYYPGHDRPFTIDNGRIQFLIDQTYRWTLSLEPRGCTLRTSISTNDTDRDLTTCQL